MNTSSPIKRVPASEARVMTVAGIMSGTSADGIDVAFARITAPRNSQNKFPRMRLLAHVAVPYPPAVRKCILQMMNADNASVAEMSRLHWRLGQLYADAVKLALKKHPMRLDLVGCHGQTIYHQGIAQKFLGAPVACTWQMGEASVIAAKLGVPVVSDFRPADLALGGQGAPLVPLLDYVAFHHPTRNRVLQNLGGIANLTVIPAGASPEAIFAFDTGPANMVIDALMTKCFDKKYDPQGATAKRGHVLEPVVEHELRARFFQAPPPKSAGREQFGREFVAGFLADCHKQSKRPEDAVATATALTARSIGQAWKDFVAPVLGNAPTDYIVAGGGARNRILMEMIRRELEPLGKINTETSDEFGIPAAAKEAMAFALLAYQTWHRQPGNLPRATGATRAAILGKITHA
ncbi:MAG TPA: anhydro-N-acetylmuramic acid kinase [Acidobacteriaceae bacterium]|nr:anhydro-N-acetylmuramic acid kinase [Acidobacteriaceae bacterium]